MNDELSSKARLAALMDELANVDREIVQLRKAIQWNKAAHILDVALRYAIWMKWIGCEGIGDTYSTFRDDFGYEAKPGEDKYSLYRKVHDVIEAAKGDYNP